MAGKMINIEKYTAVLCTNKEQAKWKYEKKKTPITKALKRIARNKFNKRSARIVPRKLQNTTENIKENLNKCKDISCSYIRWLNVINMTILPTWSTDSVQSLCKSQLPFLHKLASWS